MKIFKKTTNFEWDKSKNKQNIQKHGISFKTAAKVFDDILRIEYFDEAHSQNEDRYITIGMVYDVVFVVYTMRNSNIRIISARMANKEEAQLYYES